MPKDLKTPIKNIDLEKLPKLVLDKNKKNKKYKKNSQDIKGINLQKLLVLMMSLSIALVFSLGAFAPDIAILIFLLTLVLSFYKKYPF